MAGLVTVRYTAPTTISNAAELTAFVQEHLQDYMDPLVREGGLEWLLDVELFKLEFPGKVAMNVLVSLNQEPVKFTVHCFSQPPKIFGGNFTTYKRRFRWQQRNGLFIFLAWWVLETARSFGRACFPSRAARAIGSPFGNGLVLESLHECLADIRSQIAEVAGKDSPGWVVSHGRVAWGATMVVGGGVVAATMYFLLSDPRIPELASRVGGIFSVALGSAGIGYGSYLWRLPRRELESTSAGQKLVKFLGMRSPFQVHALALLMVICSAGTLALGLWLVFG